MRSHVEAPDGGYGWVVVASTFFIMGLTAAVLKNFGLFFLEIQRHFGVLTSTTSWVTSTTIATFHLAAPAASALSMYITHRGVIILGGVLAASGMILASLDLTLPWMYVSMGILQGLGIAFSWIPANIMVSHYFRRWRAMAYAIASSGECVFALVFSPLFQWFIEAYTWQGSLLLIGGLQLNICVCGALVRPLARPSPGPSLHRGDSGSAGVAAAKKKPSFHWSLLRRTELLLYIFFAIFAASGFFIPPLFLVPFATSLDIEPYWAASGLSLLATADLAGRLLCGWLAHMRLVRNLQLLVLVVTLLGVVTLLLPLAQDRWALLAFASLYGLLFGCTVAIHITAIVDIVGLEEFDSGLGLFMLFRSAGGFVAPPLAGWLVDQVNDFSVGFYLAGLCLIMSGVFVLLVDCLLQRKQASTGGTQLNTEASSPQETPNEILKCTDVR